MIRFGRVQLRIMQILWQRGPLTAREITDALSTERTVAHSTVQTLLRELEAKGAVDHGVQDRTFIFKALVAPEQVRKKATREFLDHMFEGSPAGLVAYLVRNERIPQKELHAIQELIDELSSKGKGKRKE